MAETVVRNGEIWYINRVGSDEAKPVQRQDVLLRLKTGEIHEGRWLRNANKYHQNVRKWKVYKINKYIDEDEIEEWRPIE